jgi:glucokinase
VAGLAEALFGAGRGFSPVFYMTVGSGIGGGLVIDGEIYRGCGRGAAEVGHLRPVYPLTPTPHDDILEHFASGWGIGRAAGTTGQTVADAARRGDPAALAVLDRAAQALAEGICSVVKLLCPRRVIIGGGVSLVGEELFFQPVRRYVTERGMAALAGLTEIVPAALGEEVVLHGALALARRKLGG